MKKLMILGSLLLALMACKKSEVTTISKQTAVNLAALKDTVANPANDYDSIGYWHNIILDGVLSQNQAIATAPNLQRTTAAVIAQTKIKMGRTLTTDYFGSVEQTVNDRSENFQSVIIKASFSSKTRASLSTLMTLVSDEILKGDNETALHNAILSWENGVIDDKSLLPSEKQQLLLASSVARYSAHYWSTSSHGAALKMRDIVKWIGAVTSDIAGAVVSDNPSYAADCSAYAYDLINYSMP